MVFCACFHPMLPAVSFPCLYLPGVSSTPSLPNFHAQSSAHPFSSYRDHFHVSTLSLTSTVASHPRHRCLLSASCLPCPATLLSSSSLLQFIMRATHPFSSGNNLFREPPLRSPVSESCSVFPAPPPSFENDSYRVLKVVYLFSDRISLCSPGWPQPHIDLCSLNTGIKSMHHCTLPASGIAEAGVRVTIPPSTFLLVLAFSKQLPQSMQF